MGCTVNLSRADSFVVFIITDYYFVDPGDKWTEENSCPTLPWRRNQVRDVTSHVAVPLRKLRPLSTLRLRNIFLWRRIKCFLSMLRWRNFKNPTIRGHFVLVFEEISVRDMILVNTARYWKRCLVWMGGLTFLYCGVDNCYGSSFIFFCPIRSSVFWPFRSSE